jgi:primary-amine oxidase
MSGPFSFDGSFRRLWMTWRRNHAGSYILPVNFYQYLDVSGTDPSQWKILKVRPNTPHTPTPLMQYHPKHIYHGQVFDTADAFLAAFHNGTLVRHPEQADPALDLSWTARTRRGRDRDLDDRPGPSRACGTESTARASTSRGWGGRCSWASTAIWGWGSGISGSAGRGLSTRCAA